MKEFKTIDEELNEFKELERIESEFNSLPSNKKMNWAYTNFPKIIEILKPEEEELELLLECIKSIHLTARELNLEKLVGFIPKSNSEKNYSTSGKLNTVRTRKISF